MGDRQCEPRREQNDRVEQRDPDFSVRSHRHSVRQIRLAPDGDRKHVLRADGEVFSRFRLHVGAPVARLSGQESLLWNTLRDRPTAKHADEK